MLLGLILFWHIYVPVHELLHVSGQTSTQRRLRSRGFGLVDRFPTRH
jgi:hypothetical protein